MPRLSGSHDGIVLEPLYEGRADVTPIEGRGARPWLAVQVLDFRDPDDANAQARRDVTGGVDGLALRFDQPVCGLAGLPPTENAMRAALESIDLAAIHLRLEPHPAGARLADTLRNLVARSGVAPGRARLAFGLDPVGATALEGADSGRTTAMVSLFHQLHAGGFQGEIATLDGRFLHEAGATTVQELAFILAAAVWWLRATKAAGIPPDAALPHFGASLAVDRDLLLSVAKLRAMRLVWARLTELCRTPGLRLPIHTETGRRGLTRAAPHTNIVRAAIAAFAAAIGGADSIAVLPYTTPLGQADRRARALALATQHLLRSEAGLDRPADPLAGSGAAEALTESLAERTWEEFQAIEVEGGILASIVAGAFPARLRQSRESLAKLVAGGGAPLVGVTHFRDAGDLVAVESEAAAPGAFSPLRLENLAPGAPT